ncbi:hypothetical protein EDC01DRAFT_418811 [Geopyxis carbonaria]|nr:hypothetical protein EDC01DRAFT_418811 [Geopyxis carbonaria]
MSDEIPLSEAEKAFFEAMNGADQNDQADDATSTTVIVEENTPTTNGHEEHSSEPEQPTEVEEVVDTNISVGGQEEQNTPSEQSSRNSVDPSSVSTPIVTAVAPDSGAEQPITTPEPHVPVPSMGEKTESALSIPTTPQAQTIPTKSVSPPGAAQSSSAAVPTKTSTKRKRLPQDVVGQLEDRIEDDPKGDIDAWMGLIDEYQKKGKIDDARSVYERFFIVFPSAAKHWIEYIKMELNHSELLRVENIFSRCLMAVQDVELWSLYLDYIRRRNDLTNDPAGKARSVISQAYDFVLSNVGHDPDSGRIWKDQIAFVKSGPGILGGTGWLDQQKMDNLRKVYQKAINQPVEGVDLMWKEYGEFESGLNKLTARKFLQDRSSAYMTARTTYNRYCVITNGLRRDSTPRLPPAPGYEGEDDWNYQISLWKQWINYEKDDPLVIREDGAAFTDRVIYVCKQALMAMQFAPEIWYDVAEFCFANNLPSKGDDFLKQGLKANPESCLLTFKYAERMEATSVIEDAEEVALRKGQLVRKPYDELFSTLYALYTKMQSREKDELERLEEEYANDNSSDSSPSSNDGYGNDYDDDRDGDKKSQRMVEKENRINALKAKGKAELLNLSKVISAVWINLMHVMRRIQGHGSINGPIGGSRQVFADARKRGKIISDVYIASALIEYRCYGDPAALKIFERGMKLFPDDENFALEYLKHLININDITNARAMFETFVSKVPPEKCQRIYQYFYEYESHYGDLAQIYKLEKRMAELFDSTNKLDQFRSRYTYKTVDPCSFLPVISPTQQGRPKATLISPENMPPGHILPPIPPPLIPGHLPTHPIPGSAPMGIPGVFAGVPPPPPPPPPANIRISSPKRPAEDDNDFSSRVRKVPRSDSPAPILKGAAGRRLNQARQQQQQQQQQQAGGASSNQQKSQSHGGRDNMRRDNQSSLPVPPPPPQPTLPDSILYLLSILPPSREYTAVRFVPEEMVALLGRTAIPQATSFQQRQYVGNQHDPSMNSSGGGYYN